MRDEAGEPVVLRGVAVPYDQRIAINGATEYFRGDAFDRRDNGFTTAPLQWGHADRAVTLVGAEHVEYHNTATGLLFSARIPASPYAGAVLRLALAGDLKCSVSFDPIEVGSDGGVCAAFLHHVSLGTRACYATTCWMEDSVTRYPRLSGEAAQWRRHLEAHLKYAA